MTFDIKIAEECNKEKWDEVVSLSPHGTIFHTWKWLKIMEKHSIKNILNTKTKAILYPIMVSKGLEIIGLLPIYYYQSRFFRIVSSPPSRVENFYLGPVLSNYDSLKSRDKQEHLVEFNKEIDKYIKNNLKPNFILINSSPGLEDSRPFKWSGYEVEPKYTYILNLKAGKDKIWKGFSKSLRYYIEKARKEGIEVTEGSKDDLDCIYAMLKNRGRISATKEFMTEIFENISQDNLNVLIAKKENELLSGIITISYKNKVSFWIGSPKVSYKGISPNELILWESIKSAIDKGYEFYEIIGADELVLYPFKSKFNAELIIRLNLRWFSPKFMLINNIYRAIRPKEY